jgi:DUF438 domain-containing protein
MTTAIDLMNETARRADVMDQLPVGITVLDQGGRILYYNATSARFVDRKPEYLGRDLRACHDKPASVARIDRMFEDLRTGGKDEVHYEAERNGRVLAVTVVPYRVDGSIVGFIQSVTVKR